MKVIITYELIMLFFRVMLLVWILNLDFIKKLLDFYLEAWMPIIIIVFT